MNMYPENTFISKVTSGRYTDRVRQQNVIIYELLSLENGRKAWHLIHVQKIKHAAFLKHIKQGKTMHLPDYGELLYSGFRHPPDRIYIQLQKQYGVSLKRYSSDQ